MIDIENEMFNIIAQKVREKWPTAFVTGEYVHAPSSFPCVSFVEASNTPYRRTQSTDSLENHASVMYEVDVYSNKKTGKKTECKEIASVIDETMMALGFDRVMLNPIPNREDATIYRIASRYRAVVSKDNKVYRR